MVKVTKYDHVGSGQRVEFQLLGPVAAYLGEQRFELGARREQCLLVALLSAESQPVSRNTLMKWVWDDPTASAERDLNKLMASLRKHLDPVALREALVSKDGLCSLEIPPETVDAHRFDKLVSRAWRLDEAARVEVLREALEMFRGEPLAGLRGVQIEGYRSRLMETYRTAKIECTRAELQLGQHDRLVPELAKLARADPLDERVAGLLMVAHYRTGNRQSALTTFRFIQRQLRDELGADVSKELKDLHHRILAQDPGLDLPRPRKRPSVPVPPGSRPITGRRTLHSHRG